MAIARLSFHERGQNIEISSVNKKDATRDDYEAKEDSIEFGSVDKYLTAAVTDADL